MKIITRAPSEPVGYHAHAQRSSESLSTSVAIAQDVVLQPSERAIWRAKLLVDNLEPFMFRAVLINFQTPKRMLKMPSFRRHCGNCGGDRFPLRHFKKLDQQCTAGEKGNPFRNCGTRDNGS